MHLSHLMWYKSDFYVLPHTFPQLFIHDTDEMTVDVNTQYKNDSWVQCDDLAVLYTRVLSCQFRLPHETFRSRWQKFLIILHQLGASFNLSFLFPSSLQINFFFLFFFV